MERKIAVITGGSRGLGKDMAFALAKDGKAIVITYKKEAEMALEVVKDIERMGGKALALPLNMDLMNEVKAFPSMLASEMSKAWNTQTIHYLINNAGMGATISFENVNEDIFDSFTQVHFKGVYFLTQGLLSQISSGGGIVNISTGTTRFCVPGYSVYASMKGGIEVFTKYLAKELGSKGIRSNVVAPGPIETDFNQAAIRNNPQMKTFLSGLSPLGRVGEASDVGSVVSFLCSDAAGWINGQRIEVSGGINI